MPWVLTASLDEYVTAAWEFLVSRPVEHTIELGVVEGLRARPAAPPRELGPHDPLFGWWRPVDRGVAAVVLHTPPYPLLLGGLPPGSAPELAGLLAGVGRQLPGVNSRDDAAAEFATAWGEQTGLAYATFRRSRLHRLAGLVPPEPMPDGAPRVAGEPDRDLLERWSRAFASEVNDLTGLRADVVSDRLSYGGLTLWEARGRPVAMAGHVRPAAGVVRVGPVYTPPELRGRGYGGAVTAAVTSAAIGAGAHEVVLFTDLANPTSNALYRRLGYEPVADRVVLSFGSRPQVSEG
jgi:RimJ/RimL family protein N-acetyltransferase